LIITKTCLIVLLTDVLRMGEFRVLTNALCRSLKRLLTHRITCLTPKPVVERPDILTRASDLQEISPARASTRRDALAGRNSEHTWGPRP
jgi:hypothetical protein